MRKALHQIKYLSYVPLIPFKRYIALKRVKDGHDMIGHLIDDDELDTISVKNMVKAQNNLAITSSNSLKDLNEWTRDDEVDFFLLDINRPDSSSMENDLIEIRRWSSAPVVFITGDNADNYRERATLAGAEGVIEKNGLSLDLLQQMLFNIVARSQASQKTIPVQAIAAPPKIDHEGTVSANKFSLALSYLETSLARTEDIDLSAEAGQALLRPIRQAAASLKFYTQADPDFRRVKAVPKIIRELQAEAFALAASKDVTIAIQLSKSGFMKLPSPAIAQAGLKHLLDGVIQASSSGDTVSFVAAPANDGMAITISSKTKIISDLTHIFSKRSPVYLKQYAAMQSMNLAALLLRLTPEDFELVSHGSVQRIRIKIKGQIAA
jgi:DNA-binding NarL/FixJ family response regulator